MLSTASDMMIPRRRQQRNFRIPLRFWVVLLAVVGASSSMIGASSSAEAEAMGWVLLSSSSSSASNRLMKNLKQNKVENNHHALDKIGFVDKGNIYDNVRLCSSKRRRRRNTIIDHKITKISTNMLATRRGGGAAGGDDRRPVKGGCCCGEAPWISGMKNSLASGLAAGCSKLILAPFDTIKTLQQASMIGDGGSAAAAISSAGGLSIWQAVQTIMERPRGFLEFYSGVGVAVVGSMPSVGLYFGIYSFSKKKFQQWDPNLYEQRQILYVAISAAIGNTIASASRVPYEVLKQKFQTKVYTTIGDAMRDLSFRTLFPKGGIASQTLRDVPYAIYTLLAYEHLKSVWKVRAQKKFPTIPIRSWDLLVGGMAGGIGSYLTNPMDIIKTRLQTDGTSSANLYNGSIRTCAKLTYREGGPSAFLRGSVPRLLHKIPGNGFFFLFYEFFRSVVNVQDDFTSTRERKKIRNAVYAIKATTIH